MNAEVPQSTFKPTWPNEHVNEAVFAEEDCTTLAQKLEESYTQANPGDFIAIIGALTEKINEVLLTQQPLKEVKVFLDSIKRDSLELYAYKTGDDAEPLVILRRLALLKDDIAFAFDLLLIDTSN